MGITLLKPNQTWPLVRILHAPSFGATAAAPTVSGTAWLPLLMQLPGQRKHGFEVLEFERCALPFVGRAKFKLEYGRFADGLISADPASAENLRSGQPWDPTQDTLAVDDLRHHEIRIQVRETEADAWVTAWWGQVEYQEDIGAPGAEIPMGTRIYHCVDGLNSRAGRWMMSRHGYHDASLTIANARGALGYNVPAAGTAEAIVSKNRSATTFTTEAGTTAFCHTAPGRGDGYWTAQAAVEHALDVARPIGEPKFAFQTAEALLGAVHAWPVRETDTAMDVLINICRRERGRGCVFLDWTEGGGPDGPLTVFLNIRPQLLLDVTYTDPTTGTPVTIPGADTRLTTVNVDLIGDHRVRKADFKLGDPLMFRYDYLETLGEEIEVAATLAYVDGQTGSSGQWKGVALAPAWSNQEATDFRALTGANILKRNALRWRPVFQLHSLRQDWNGQAGDGNGGASVALQRIDFRCDDSGNVLTPDLADAPDTSPAAVQLLSDIPMFERFTYAGTNPALYDGADVVSPTDRRRLLPLVRISANRFLTHDQTGAHTSMAADHSHLWITHAENEDVGTRYFSLKSDTTLDAGFDYNKIVLTVGLRLPHHVRFASGNAAGQKRAQLIHPNFHLWLAAPGTIWELDTSVGDAALGYAAKRNAGNGSLLGGPGVLRDDRSGLAALHALSWAWYGTSTDRRSANWSLRACGFLPSFSAIPEITDDPLAADATDIPYPTLGQVINTLSGNGEAHIINTPVTRISYDHKSGVTSWSSEWSELETER